MSDDFIPQTRHQVTEADLELVGQALRSDRLTQGRFTEALEQRLCDYTGARYAIACSSCTTALTLAWLAVEIRGQEVVLPTLTFTATAQAVLAAGGTVKLADIDPCTWNLDHRPLPELHGSVDFAGLPAVSSGAMVSDAAHSLGAMVLGRAVGTLADLTCLSFHATKLVTGGEGGAVLTNDGAYAGRLRALRDWGRVEGRTCHPGLSGHLSEAQAALIDSQLQRADDLLRRRRAAWRIYEAELGRLPHVQTQRIPDGYTHAAHLFVLWLDPDLYDRDHFRELLQARGIGTQIHYRPLHRQPLWQADPADFPHAERYYHGAVSLPLFNGITEVQLQRVVRAVKEELENVRQG